MIPRLIRAAVFLIGCAAIAYGVSLVHLAAGIITAGLLVCVLAVLAEKDAEDHELVDKLRRHIETERSSRS